MSLAHDFKLLHSWDGTMSFMGVWMKNLDTQVKQVIQNLARGPKAKTEPGSGLSQH